MKEFLPNREKMIAIPLFFAVLECQSGAALAQPPLSEMTVRPEVYGQSYELFERAVDETTEQEFRAVGIQGDVTEIRRRIKYLLPVFWYGYGTKLWDDLPTTYPVLRYGILHDGAKIFFDTPESVLSMPGYSRKEHDENCNRLMTRLTETTSIPAERAHKKEDANCTMEFLPSNTMGSSLAAFAAFAESPASSFDNSAGRAVVSVYSASTLNDYFTLGGINTPQIVSFVRSNILIDYATHEFSHTIGIGHVDDEGMYPYKGPAEDSDYLKAKSSQDFMSKNGNLFRIFFYDDYKEGARMPRNVFYDSQQKKAFKLVSYIRTPEESDSFMLIRWLRSLAINGKLKDLLIKGAELAAVKKKTNKKE
jgi:hypothetical protein